MPVVPDGFLRGDIIAIGTISTSTSEYTVVDNTSCSTVIPIAYANAATATATAAGPCTTTATSSNSTTKTAATATARPPLFAATTGCTILTTTTSTTCFTTRGTPIMTCVTITSWTIILSTIATTATGRSSASHHAYSVSFSVPFVSHLHPSIRSQGFTA